MATYIQGLTDYIPQIQPFQPDYNFFGNIMQTRQTKFDAAKKKINDLYGTLLNSPLSRDVNIKRREEFFKAIDQDIKKISGLDLSLQQNVDQALNVFSGFYDDKYIVADMVKTRNAYSELKKGENYKYCNDPEKCNGQYWDAGIKKLQYKLDEFKNVSDEESLNFQIGEYDPYFDWKKDAAKRAKEMGYEVKLDTPSGDWIVRDTNGVLVEGGLRNFFTTLYGDDPRITKNYETEAYVARKDYGRNFAETFGSELDAEKHYTMKIINDGLETTRKDLATINNSYNQMNDKFLKLQQKVKVGNATAREKRELDEIIKQKPTLELSKSVLENRINEIQNNIDANDITGLTRRADLSAATTYQKRDLQNLAKALSEIKQSRTLEVNPYAKMYKENALQKDLAKFKAGLESDLLKQKFQYDYTIKYNKAFGTPEEETKGYVIEALPGTTAKSENVEDQPDALYNVNRQEVLSKFDVATSKSKEMLLSLIDAAKTNVKNDSKNSGALAFLNQFGDYDNIKDMASLEKAIVNKKLSSIGIFESFARKATSKNPGADYLWADAILKNPETRSNIDKVFTSTQAFNKLIKNSQDINKKIADQIYATRSEGNVVAYYADKLISKTTGQLETKENFVNKLIKEDPFLSKGAAEKRYDLLKDQFYKRYDSQEGISLMQGAGLPGGGITSGRAMQYNLDLAKTEDPAVKNFIDVVRGAFAQPATTKTVIGDLSKETYEKDDNTKVKDFLTWYLNEWKNPKSPGRRAITATISNVSAENANLRGITFTGIDPAAIDQYRQTAKDPGVFYKEDVSKGLTVFIDKRYAPKVDYFSKPVSDLETVIKTDGGIVLNGFEETAGTIQYTKLNDNEVQVTWNKMVFNNGDIVPGRSQSFVVSMGKLDTFHESLEAELKNLHQQNLYAEQEYTQSLKNRK